MGQRAFTRRQRLEVAQVLLGAAMGHLAEPDRGAGAMPAALAILDRGLRLLRDAHGATPGEGAALTQHHLLLVLEDGGDQEAGAAAVREWEAAHWPAAPLAGAAGRAQAAKQERLALAG